jgi:hypothetical protein
MAGRDGQGGTGIVNLADLDVDEVARYLADLYQGERIDWDDALLRVEHVFDVDLPGQMTAPLIRKIKRTYRAEIKARTE